MSMLLRLEHCFETPHLVIFQCPIFKRPTGREFHSNAVAPFVVGTKCQEPEAS